MKKNIIIFSAIDWDTQWQQQELAIFLSKNIMFCLWRIQSENPKSKTLKEFFLVLKYFKIFVWF